MYAQMPSPGGKPQKRNHSERELQTEDYLAENQELSNACMPEPSRHDNRGQNRQTTGQQRPFGARHANVEKALHHDLSGTAAE
jgi:hypothetical protein